MNTTTNTLKGGQSLVNGGRGDGENTFDALVSQNGVFKLVVDDWGILRLWFGDGSACIWGTSLETGDKVEARLYVLISNGALLLDWGPPEEGNHKWGSGAANDSFREAGYLEVDCSGNLCVRVAPGVPSFWNAGICFGTMTVKIPQVNYSPIGIPDDEGVVFDGGRSQQPNPSQGTIEHSLSYTEAESTTTLLEFSVGLSGTVGVEFGGSLPGIEAKTSASVTVSTSLTVGTEVTHSDEFSYATTVQIPPQTNLSWDAQLHKLKQRYGWNGDAIWSLGGFSNFGNENGITVLWSGGSTSVVVPNVSGQMWRTYYQWKLDIQDMPAS